MKRQLFALCFMVSCLASAQTPEPLRLGGINALMEQYLKEAQEKAQIYYGKEPLPYSPHIKNHPYLMAGVFNGGLLSYDGIQYPNVNILLDLYRDQLLVLSPYNYSYIILQPGEVNFADMYGYRIIYFRPDGLKGCPPEGYYQLLYDGKYTVLEKQACSLFETRKGEVTEGTFNRSTKYYILKDGVYHTVKSKGSVLNVFKSHKKELNQYSKQQRLNFRKETEKAIVSMVKQFETLNQKP